jgi:hypothetical protein
MGYWKNRQAELDALDYSPPEGRFVCPACVIDESLKTVLGDAAEDETCSYCGADDAAELSVLLDQVSDALRFGYADPAEELPYSTADDGYQGEVEAGSDLVRDFEPWSDCDELLEDVATAFEGSSWCRKDYFGLSGYEALLYGWAGFSDQVKYRTRFLFLQELGPADGPGKDAAEIPVGNMLEALGRVFTEFELFRILPAGTEFVRARVVNEGDRPSSPAELGTPPRELARFPNRMSPAGIPMFYAALDEPTAVLETYQPSDGAREEIALAHFRSSRPLNMLDLTVLPAMPSVFDPANRAKRDTVAFVRAFEADFTKPVSRDTESHTEYVPTQIVTEFLRHRMRDAIGAGVDGVIYNSSRRGGHVAVVIFAEAEHCGPRGARAPRGSDLMVELSDVRYAPPSEFAHLWAPP